MHLAPLTSSSSTFIYYELSRFLTSFGIPETIVTDQGANFCSELTQHLFTNLGIRKIKCTPYHPKSNGALERSHCTIKEHLKFHLHPEASNWDAILPATVNSFNTHIYSTTKFAPFELMFARKPRLPQYYSESETYEDFFNKQKQIYSQMHEIAKENQEAAKYKNVSRANLRICRKQQKLEPGDQVYVSLSQDAQHQRRNPNAAFHGPYPVVLYAEPNATLLINGKEVKYHVSLLKKRFAPATRINFFTSLLLFLLLIILCFATTELCPTATAINSETEVYFNFLVSVGLHQSDWTFASAHNITALKEKFQLLHLLVISIATAETKICQSPYITHGTISICLPNSDPCLIHSGQSLSRRLIRLNQLLENTLDSTEMSRTVSTLHSS